MNRNFPEWSTDNEKLVVYLLEKGEESFTVLFMTLAHSRREKSVRQIARV